MALSLKVRRSIVIYLACFVTASDVVKAVKEEFGLVVTRQQVWNFDASKAYNRSRMAKELVALFEETRKEFKEEIESIPIANKAFRLSQLQALYEKAANPDGGARANPVLAASILEQAAKESGDAFSNKLKHELTGKDGGPIQSENKGDLSKLNKQQLETLLPIAEALHGDSAPASNPG